MATRSGAGLSMPWTNPNPRRESGSKAIANGKAPRRADVRVADDRFTPGKNCVRV
jgi:hypothetical protein